MSQHAQQALNDVLSGDRCLRLLAEFRKSIENGPPVAVLKRFDKVRIGDAADSLSSKALHKLIKRGRHITDRSSPSELHEFRLRIKRTCYSLECFADFYPSHLNKPLKALKRLQNVLGNYQDSLTASERLHSYYETLPLTLDRRRELIAIGGLLQFEADRRHNTLEKLPKAWKHFERVAKTAIQRLRR